MAFDETAPLVNRLREGDDLTSRIEAADEIERLREALAAENLENSDLRAANDAAEVNAGYGNGDLWRFWRDKALEMAARNTRLRAALEDIADGMGEITHQEIGRFAPAIARKALNAKAASRDELRSAE